MHKFKMKLLYNEGEISCTKTELLNFKLGPSLAKLVMFRARLTSSGLTFWETLQLISS